MMRDLAVLSGIRDDDGFKAHGAISHIDNRRICRLVAIYPGRRKQCQVHRQRPFLDFRKDRSQSACLPSGRRTSQPRARP
jgi:hypothetical protein